MYYLYRGGNIDALIFMRATEYMNREYEFVVWKAFYKSI